MDSPPENRREPALTVRGEARPFYATLFVLQTFGLVARRFYIELAERSDSIWTAMSDGDILDVVAVSLSQLERDGAKAVISTILLMEVWDAMMGTRDAVNDWLEKRRQKARTEGREEGREEGIALGRAEGREKGIALGREEGREEGIALGREELAAEIVAWNNRRLLAEANGELFDEPPPGENSR